MKSENHKTFNVGDWRVDPATDRISRGNETHSLRPKTMDVLVYLAKHQGDVVSADELIEALWPGVFVSDASVYACINQLREAFGDDSQNPEYIETIPKRGYRLTAPVNFDAEDSREAARTPIYKMMGLTAVVLLAFIGVLYGLKPGGPPPETNPVSTEQASIAVMPFIDLSPANDQEYFAEGISEELLNALADIRGLRVTGRTSSFSFKGQEASVMEIGEVLGVTTILEGSVRREGERVRIAAQLVSTEDGFQIWSQTYDRDLGSVFAVQDEISQAIVAALRIELTGEVSVLVAIGTTDMEAYDYYLRGLQSLRVNSFSSLEQATVNFRAAIRLDDGFLPAYAGLANSIAHQVETGSRVDLVAYDEAAEIARQALALDTNFGAGYAALGRVAAARGDVEQSIVYYEHALALDGLDATSLGRFASALTLAKQRERAYKIFWRATELDPLNGRISRLFGVSLRYWGRLPEAGQFLARAVELAPEDPSNWAYLGALKGYELGDVAGYIRHIETSADLDRLDPEGPAYLSLAALSLGDGLRALDLAEQALELGPNVGLAAYAKARALLFAGDEDAALTLALAALENPTTLHRGFATGYDSRFLLEQTVLQILFRRNDFATAEALILNNRPGLAEMLYAAAARSFEDLAVEDMVPLSELVHIYRETDRGAEADKLAAHLEFITPENYRIENDRHELRSQDYWQLAVGEAAGSDLDLALTHLETAAQGFLGEWRTFFQIPVFWPLREDPRYMALIANIEANMAAQLAGLAVADE